MQLVFAEPEVELLVSRVALSDCGSGVAVAVEI
jgi:hypothetical protein